MPAKKTVSPGNDKLAEKISDLLPNERNPRKPWKDAKQRKSFLQSLQTFGDLSGIVFNRTSSQLVGGHKRVEEFKSDPHNELVISDRLSTPDPSGTLAYGHVILSDGTRFAYREVAWNKAKEAGANLAANKWSADWDMAGVQDLLMEANAGGFDLEITGFDLADISKGGIEEGDKPRSPASRVNLTATFEVLAECEDEADQQRVYNILTEKGIKCRLLTL